MYSPSRSSGPRGSSDRRPSERKTFERKPYAGKPKTDRSERSPRTERSLDPRQMRYQVIGRTTDESDLIVQISPAFYEYVRSMAHQGVKAPRVEEPRYSDRREDRSEAAPRYGKFAHPFHKDPIYSKDQGEGERRGGRLEQRAQVKKVPQDEWYGEDVDMGDIDTEMDDEYTMIKEGFAKLDKKETKPKRTVRSTNTKKR